MWILPEFFIFGSQVSLGSEYGSNYEWKMALLLYKNHNSHLKILYSEQQDGSLTFFLTKKKIWRDLIAKGSLADLSEEIENVDRLT